MKGYIVTNEILIVQGEGHHLGTQLITQVQRNQIVHQQVAQIHYQMLKE